jgi:membrane protein
LATPRRGLSASQLAERLQVDGLQLEPVLETLVALDWVGQLNEAEGEEEARFLLLADPDATPLEPLMRQLLLDKAEAVQGLWEKAGWPGLRLRDAL